MDLIKIFKNSGTQYPVCIQGDINTPFFCADDISKVLDMKCIRSVTRDFDETEKVVRIKHTVVFLHKPFTNCLNNCTSLIFLLQ